MSKLDKLLAGIRNNPKDVDFNDIKKILENYGYIGETSGGGSSHWVFRKEGKVTHITIPFKKPIKAIYIKKALLAIDEEIAIKEVDKKKQKLEDNGEKE